ncbi:MAG: sulfur dioxygenase [Chlamydiales bacterium]|jgi:sulfur dioxygenase
MIFRQLFDSSSSTYTYLIASGKGREAIIIDPVLEHTALYIKLIQELNLQLVISLDTHTHADHITASGSLSKQTNCARALGENTKAECVTMRVKEGEKINVDGVTLETLYTPGHTDDSYSFFMGDRVFTGDTLLVRGTGRTDFQCGDSHQQYDSIFNKLLKLAPNTLVYPAHDYKGMTVSTIEEEKLFNPRLQVNSSDEYAAIMDNLNLANPKLMDIAVPANMKCGMFAGETAG